MFKVSAIQISDDIDIAAFMSEYTAELLYSDHLELFYEVDIEKYVSVFRYGVVCFFNYEEKIDEVIKLLSKYCEYFYDSELTKNYLIDADAPIQKIGFNKAEITYFDVDTLRIILLNVAQSVALDYYFQKARIMLEKTSKYIAILEERGTLNLQDKKLKRFVGKTHNLKNQIVENLYILDSAPEIRHNDYLIKVDNEIRAALFLEKRFENIHEELQIVREHLECFSDITKNKSSIMLEWIIIVLLSIFVLNIIIERII